MTTTTTKTGTARRVTDETTAEAIIRALQPTGYELTRWAAVKHLVPGDFWQHGRALERLHRTGEVYLIRMNGSLWLCLGEPVEREIAARFAARGEVRPVRELWW